MSETADMLFEIGTEELPPKALRLLAESFVSAMQKQLQAAQLSYAEIFYSATPRRLGLRVGGLAGMQADKIIERRGPAVSAAYDAAGKPTKALLGFAKSCGADSKNLEKQETDKGAWMVWRGKQPGQTTESLLPAMLERALAELPIPKRMRWGEHEFQFIRPVHWVVLIYAGKVVPGSLFGIPFANKTYGHRFHHPHAIEIRLCQEYLDVLKHANVLADFSERKQAIRDQVAQLAKQVKGEVEWDEALLDEVTGLVEWPKAILGQFDRRFLSVPAEALVAAMKEHQRYFHLKDKNGQLLPHFITVSNIESINPLVVQQGNEKVIRPRLVDAEFFWNSDRKTALKERRQSLKDVVFEKKLGSLFDKSERVAALSAKIAAQMGCDAEKAQLAAQLSKCDLLSDMVFEFPELQGIMGHYYAQHDNLGDDVALAIEEQYLPRGAGDRLPESELGQCLALADRLDSMVGLFAIGKNPTGDKDPFALRRAAFAILRILIELEIDLDLMQMLHWAAENFPGAFQAQTATEAVFQFIMERLRGYYTDKDVNLDVIDAVLARRPSKMTDLDLRARAIQAFKRLPEAESLAAANKRIRNILKQANQDVPETIDEKLFTEKAEKGLAAKIDSMTANVLPLLEKRQYEQAMRKLASLKKPVDDYFDQVMVMVEDNHVRRNRLALLRRLSELFLRTADLSRLQS